MQHVRVSFPFVFHTLSVALSHTHCDYIVQEKRLGHNFFPELVKHLTEVMFDNFEPYRLITGTPEETEIRAWKGSVGKYYS